MSSYTWMKLYSVRLQVDTSFRLRYIKLHKSINRSKHKIRLKVFHYCKRQICLERTNPFSKHKYQLIRITLNNVNTMQYVRLGILWCAVQLFPAELCLTHLCLIRFQYYTHTFSSNVSVGKSFASQRRLSIVWSAVLPYLTIQYFCILF